MPEIVIVLSGVSPAPPGFAAKTLAASFADVTFASLMCVVSTALAPIWKSRIWSKARALPVPLPYDHAVLSDR